MNWQNLFLSANGRIGQKDFWIGFLIVFVASIILGLIPILGQIAGLLLIYPTVCLYSKRLHDFGKTGWLAALPYAVGAVIMLIMLLAGGAAFFGMASGSAVEAGGAMAAVGMIGLLAVLFFLAWLGFTLWVGLSKGDPAANQYGPPPASLIGGAATV
jgi:uncharacterized membrane protein YhaH (DUF805 family)